MQHDPAKPLHRSTLYRRRKRDEKLRASRPKKWDPETWTQHCAEVERENSRPGRKRWDAQLDEERLSLAAGIIDELNRNGCCPLYKLATPQGAEAEAKPLAGSAETIKKLRALKMPPLRILYWVAWYLMNPDLFGSMYIQDGDALCAGRMGSEEFSDVDARLNERGPVTRRKNNSRPEVEVDHRGIPKEKTHLEDFPDIEGRERRGSPICSVPQFKALGLDRRMCWYLKTSTSKIKQVDEAKLRRLGKMFPAPGFISKKERVDRALLNRPKVSKRLNEGLITRP